MVSVLIWVEYEADHKKSSRHMHRKILRINRPRKRYLEWAIDLAANNMQKYSTFLRHSKTWSILNKTDKFIFCVAEGGIFYFKVLQRHGICV